MKQFRIDPIGQVVDVRTATTVVAALLERSRGKVKQVCGGKGLCATCHVKVDAGMASLTPITAREKQTLSIISGADATSRLACQAKVIGPGVVVNLPDGIYLSSLADVEALVGRRTEADLLHPVSGAVLVPSGKIITRSVVLSMKNLESDVISLIKSTNEVNI